MGELADRTCKPCREGDAALAGEALAALVAELGGGWSVVDGHHLQKRYTFPDFARALVFVNQVGALAEAADHHPDLHLSWGKVVMELWTHTVNGLSELDFVLAARADRAFAAG